jgi:hypothetical protein
MSKVKTYSPKIIGYIIMDVTEGCLDNHGIFKTEKQALKDLLKEIETRRKEFDLEEIARYVSGRQLQVVYSLKSGGFQLESYLIEELWD